jgi:Ca2+-binding EF-hand superfamily protein
MKNTHYILPALALLATSPLAFAETTPTTTSTTTATSSTGVEDHKIKHMEHLDEDFKKHDTDGDGKLTLDEFKTLEKDQMEHRKEHKRMELSKNPEFMKNYDSNKDGKIDDGEFQHAMEAKHAAKS